ncbi:MAG: putative bifunctional diguanylate cyclase/phosphodiesterase [Kineosporiaceae bacterium]
MRRLTRPGHHGTPPADPGHRPDRVTVALAALALLVVAAGAILWWSATEGLEGVERTRQVDTRVAGAAQDIRYLDELLTHSAARYAATGDPRWQQRYDDGVVRLDEAIALSRGLSGPDATRPLDAVDDANQRLIALETRIFELGAEGRLAEAQALLTGEYEVQKARYGTGLDAFVTQQEAAAEAALESRRATLAANRAVTAGLVVALLSSVAGLWRVYRSRAVLVRQQAARLADQATTDSLTRLPNRRAAMAMLRDLSAAVARGGPGSVMFLDLDGFKAVNDTFGHAAGDRVLLEAARRLSEVTAAVAGSDGRVARLGGDEFLVVLHRDLDDARRLAQRCLTRLEEPFAVGSATSRLSASIGVVAAGTDEPDTLLQDADFAAAYAKDHGKSQVQEFVPAMRQRMIDRHRIEGELRSALAGGRLEVHYQPIVELTEPSPVTGPGHRVVGAEALVRWRMPDGSLVLPGDFIPIAEGSWLIVEIDKLVLDAACGQLAQWAAAGLELGVAVNVSGRHVIHGDLVGDVRDALTAHGVDPTRLTVELTETAVVSDVDRAAVVLSDVRALGVKVALDDFTTGYSTLTHLTTLPADTIKIDRSFVSAIDSDREHLLVEYLLRLAAISGVGVVAEGVETERQLDALDALGCRTAQGYLFTPALEPAEFLGWALEHAAPPAPLVGLPRPRGAARHAAVVTA